MQTLKKLNLIKRTPKLNLLWQNYYCNLKMFKGRENISGPNQKMTIFLLDLFIYKEKISNITQKVSSLTVSENEQGKLFI